MRLVDRRTYRAKKPACVNGFVNDRTVVWISTEGGTVQYDGPAVAIGRLRPRITQEKFLKWASHDVTEQLSAGCYMTWEQYLKQER